MKGQIDMAMASHDGAHDPFAAERARIEAEVSDLRRRVVSARSGDEADRLRSRLDEAEERLLALETLRGHCGCGGWPVGK
jgi:hypothetical protein